MWYVFPSQVRHPACWDHGVHALANPLRKASRVFFAEGRRPAAAPAACPTAHSPRQVTPLREPLLEESALKVKGRHPAFLPLIRSAGRAGKPAELGPCRGSPHARTHQSTAVHCC